MVSLGESPTSSHVVDRPRCVFGGQETEVTGVSWTMGSEEDAARLGGLSCDRRVRRSSPVWPGRRGGSV
jgi:hypothetical protein